MVIYFTNLLLGCLLLTKFNKCLSNDRIANKSNGTATARCDFNLIKIEIDIIVLTFLSLLLHSTTQGTICYTTLIKREFNLTISCV